MVPSLFFFFSPFSLCCVSPTLSRLADQLREERGADGWLHQWTLIVHLQGALGPGSSYLETWWQMPLKMVAMRHRFPGNCTLGPALPLPPCVSLLYPRDLLSPPLRPIHRDDLYLSISFTPTQRRCAAERCIDCLTDWGTRTLFNKERQRHTCPFSYVFTATGLKQNFSPYEHISLLYMHIGRGCVDGKQALYISNYTPSTLSVNKPLPLRDMWNPALAVETLSVPTNTQPARPQTDIFQSDDKEPRNRGNGLIWHILLSDLWLTRPNGNVHSASVSHSV